MSWLSGWDYRRAVTITEQSGSTLTDYQVKIELNSSNFDFSKANSDGSDIRFTEDDGETLLPYWIEKWDDVNEEATIWVKVSSIPANGETTIYLYYGNSGAESESDGEAVFEFFDDFNTDTIASGRWTVVAGTWQVDTANSLVWNDDSARARIKADFNDNGNHIYEVRLRHDEVGEYSWAGLEIKSSSSDEGDYDNGYLILHYGNTGNGRILKVTSGSLTELTSGSISIPAGQFFVMKVVYDDGDIKLYINDQLITSATDTTYMSGEVIRLFNNATNNKSSFDWIRVRKYAEQEPTASVGSETSPTISGIVKLSNGTPVQGATVISIREDTYEIVDVTTSESDGSYTLAAAGGVNNTVIVIPSAEDQNGDIKCHIQPT